MVVKIPSGSTQGAGQGRGRGGTRIVQKSAKQLDMCNNGVYSTKYVVSGYDFPLHQEYRTASRTKSTDVSPLESAKMFLV